MNTLKERADFPRRYGSPGHELPESGFQKGHGYADDQYREQVWDEKHT